MRENLLHAVLRNPTTTDFQVPVQQFFKRFFHSAFQVTVSGYGFPRNIFLPEEFFAHNSTKKIFELSQQIFFYPLLQILITILHYFKWLF